MINFIYSGVVPFVCEMFLDGNYFSRVVYGVLLAHFYCLLSITKIQY